MASDSEALEQVEPDGVSCAPTPDLLMHPLSLPRGITLLRHCLQPGTEAAPMDGSLPPGIRVGVMLSGSLDMYPRNRARPVTLSSPLLYLAASTEGYPTRYVLHPGEPITYVSIQFSCLKTAGINMEDLAEARSPHDDDPLPRVLLRPADRTLCSLARQLLNCPLNSASGSLYETAKALEFAALAIEGLVCRKDTADTAALSALDVTRVQKACAILVEHMQAPPSLPELARQSGLNVRKLTRGFRRLYGDSPYAYLKRRRLERAYQLLAAGEMNVSQTAFSVGYTLPHFCSLFQKHYGHPPGQIRRTHPF
ncbi:helix-turn-helix transcriptional regulator [Phaeovibrio sulfidiphilus]|uniref:Helix-turn-helix transcriptional regulator n=1 Tax=Phaeovibrio sulfidiphilus TaxID=1220600 RepID=A0A8J6YX15_9PROT|nr:AraC family transcriptional regulator [Phaeovibrio sulfidiphilus]MBE1237227.1 helix-turn-helix transcriptional regulator [Phaeovibrio sulfidiphilus]